MLNAEARKESPATQRTKNVDWTQTEWLRIAKKGLRIRALTLSPKKRQPNLFFQTLLQGTFYSQKVAAF
jgi:hypothetical protein